MEAHFVKIMLNNVLIFIICVIITWMHKNLFLNIDILYLAEVIKIQKLIDENAENCKCKATFSRNKVYINFLSHQNIFTYFSFVDLCVPKIGSFFFNFCSGPYT